MGLSRSTTPETNKDYFDLREDGKNYISKIIAEGNPNKEIRIVHKVFKDSTAEEIIEIKGAMVIRSTHVGKQQIVAILNQDSKKIHRLSFQRFRIYKDGRMVSDPTDTFSFRNDEFLRLLDFLYSLKFIDLSIRERFVLSDDELKIENKILVDKSFKEILELLKPIKQDERVELINFLKEKKFTKEELDVLSGRKEGLELFKSMLDSATPIDEKDWQTFFENHDWIFGYGLDYKFLKILQREAHLNDPDLDGKNTSINDFLTCDNRFTVLVELKRPDTVLFEQNQNRANSWRLSTKLIDAVSQILEHKASWQLKAEKKDNFDSNNQPVNQRAYDPKVILIIGHGNQFTGADRINKIKEKTFELFRRDSRNISILTYDELYERAYFILNKKSPQALLGVAIRYAKQRISPQASHGTVLDSLPSYGSSERIATSDE